MGHVWPDAGRLNASRVPRHVDRTKAAVPGDNRGAALRQVIDNRPRLSTHNLTVAVIVQINKPRRDGQAGTVDPPADRSNRKTAHGHDSITTDGDIAFDRSRTGSIQNPPRRQQDIGVHSIPRVGGSGHAEQDEASEQHAAHHDSFGAAGKSSGVSNTWLNKFEYVARPM